MKWIFLIFQGIALVSIFISGSTVGFISYVVDGECGTNWLSVTLTVMALSYVILNIFMIRSIDDHEDPGLQLSSCMFILVLPMLGGAASMAGMLVANFLARYVPALQPLITRMKESECCDSASLLIPALFIVIGYTAMGVVAQVIGFVVSSIRRG